MKLLPSPAMALVTMTRFVLRGPPRAAGCTFASSGRLIVRNSAASCVRSASGVMKPSAAKRARLIFTVRETAGASARFGGAAAAGAACRAAGCSVAGTRAGSRASARSGTRPASSGSPSMSASGTSTPLLRSSSRRFAACSMRLTGSPARTRLSRPRFRSRGHTRRPGSRRHRPRARCSGGAGGSMSSLSSMVTLPRTGRPPSTRRRCASCTAGRIWLTRRLAATPAASAATSAPTSSRRRFGATGFGVTIGGSMIRKSATPAAASMLPEIAADSRRATRLSYCRFWMS